MKLELFIIICVLSVIFICIAYVKVNTIRYTQIKPNEKFVQEAIDRIAMLQTEHMFKQEHRPIYTKKGDFRVNFINTLNQRKQQILQQCFDQNTPNQDFTAYLENALRTSKYTWDFQRLLTTYLDVKQNIIRKCMTSNNEYTPQEFMQLKSTQTGDVVGVYIFHNQQTGQYYVGQAKRLFFRVHQHLTGHGNGDVYADYKYGQPFTIKLVKLSQSGYDDLDKLELDLINQYDAYRNGYNKTSGNGW